MTLPADLMVLCPCTAETAVSRIADDFKADGGARVQFVLGTAGAIRDRAPPASRPGLAGGEAPPSYTEYVLLFEDHLYISGNCSLSYPRFFPIRLQQKLCQGEAMKSLLISIVAVVCMATSNVFAAEIRLLSAGAVEPGLVGLLDSFHRETGHRVKVTFATAPAIRKRITEGETVDVLIAPPAVLDDLSKAGKIKGADRATVGRVGVGVTVRDGAPVPKIGTADEFKQSMLNAESLVYNQASTGLYLDRLFERLGMAAQVKAKATRYPDGAAVLNHVIKGKGNEIGFGAITEIIEYSKKGLKLVGPLPAEVQNYTTYAATVVAGEATADAAQSLVRYLSSPAAKAALAAAGIES